MAPGDRRRSSHSKSGKTYGWLLVEMTPQEDHSLVEGLRHGYIEEAEKELAVVNGDEDREGNYYVRIAYQHLALGEFEQAETLV